MKPITVTKTVYTLGELSDSARQTALEKMSSFIYEWIESDQITEYLNGELAGLLTGTYDGEISSKELKKRTGLTVEWSLSNCQGDGVAIYGTLNSDDAPNVEWHGASTAIFARNSHGHHYSHENCMTVSLFSYDEGGDENDAYTDTTEKFAEQFRDICRKLSRWGYEHIHSLTDELAIIEHLEMNDGRRFTEDGDFAPILFWSEQ
jgi:hypothetical protein